MNTSDLIGAVIIAILKEDLDTDGGGAQGTGRFVLNLNTEQTVSVARAVLADAALYAKIDMKFPQAHLSGHGLPDSALTTLPATYYRNAACPKSAFLLADVESDEETSFNEIARLGPAELTDRLNLWVRVAAWDLRLTEAQTRYWERALTGLRDLRLVSLDRFARYVIGTRDGVLSEGLPLLHALGAALPALRLPRDTFLFNAIKERQLGSVAAWRALFHTVQRRRAGLLLKQSASQLLLSEQELNVAFDKVRAVIPETFHPTIEAFIGAGSGWNDKAEALAACEWETVKPLFDGLQRERFNLGQKTLDFYLEREPTLLNDEDRDYLRLLVRRKTTESDVPDAEFYDAHRDELKEDRKLKSAWDRFVFGRPVETTDLLAGIAAALEPLYNRVPAGDSRQLRIRCDRATRRDLRELNVDAGRYFSHRYAGLPRLFGGRVEWNVGDLFTFNELINGWRASGKLNRSVAKPALQLKFVLELDTRTDAGDIQTHSSQLVWRYDPASVASQLPHDWARLARHPFLAGRAARASSNAKARAQTVNLSDVKTFVPAYDRDRGSFVPAYKAQFDLAASWQKNLAVCRANGYVTEATAMDLERSFAEFKSAYQTAIEQFPQQGAGNAANLAQLGSYAALLNSVVRFAKGDRNRELLLKPLLAIGVAPIQGGGPAALVAPWHPMRLAAMWRKANLAASLVAQLLDTREPTFGDTRLFFRDLAQDLVHPLYPELAATWSDGAPQLLSVSDAVLDYSLHEPPVVTAISDEDTNENPVEGSVCVLELVRRYLALHPHERANMSVVLFNCDSARLPQAVVDRIGAIQDDDEDVRCQVLLRHVDDTRLRDVYRSILDTDTTADAYSASEVTQDFMARLRISVIADQAPPPDPKDGCPYDIVFSQDVISRHAGLEWFAERSDPADFGSLLPSRWSRRRPAPEDDLKSSAFLCCPVQSSEGWAYLTALASMFRGDWDGDERRRLLPVRLLDFRDGRTARIFEETHDLGNWVVNYDELLDRRQLMNQNVRVIRYKQSTTQGRNLIISSRAPLNLLRSMILHRLRALGLGLPEADCATLADRLIEDANDVSGDIVLRAAKRGESASELIGVVLSRRLLRDQLGDGAVCGWYFLDDYAAWMGQREEQLADILAICPHETADGTLRVTLAVSEAKYVEAAGLAASRKESQKQLRDTVRRIDEAVFGDPERLDRTSWLSRLADLMLDGIRLPASSAVDLGAWRRAMREGRCEIDLRGTSHVFVPTAVEGSGGLETSEVPGVAGAYQQVYGRSALKRLLLAYWRNESTEAVRYDLNAGQVEAPPARWRRPGSGGSVMTGVAVPSRPLADLRTPAATATPPSSVGYDPEPAAQIRPTPTGGIGGLPPVAGGDQASDGWAHRGIAALVNQPNRPAGASEADAAWLADVAGTTRSALQQLSMQARLLTSSLTPNSALLKFAGSANLTIDQVTRKRSEMLTTFGLNVISVRPEPGVVAIAVERPVREVVSIENLWSGWRPERGTSGNQELLIGVRENDGSPLYLSPSRLHAPHTLIAGSTGSGKSMLVQNIILGIAATNARAEARIILIDPKQGVDYFAFEDLAHLDGGLIDDQEVATARLNELVEEMDRRYASFRRARVANLAAYNARAEVADRLPTVWLIHDEFAEWMLTLEYRDSVSTIVQRLGVKARAAGIYLVFAAQRPDATVMPMQLRANLGNRLILRVDSEGTSEIALGEKGAERLLGRGHLLAKLEGERDLCYAQVPLVDPAFIEAVVQASRNPPSDGET